VDRIAIVGCGLYYARDWKRLDHEQFVARQRDLVAAPRWIIDGNCASTLPTRLQAADTVVFLDLPARECLWGVVQRRLRHGGGPHHAIGVYDRITWNFIRYIAGYRRQMAPRVRQLITSHAAHAEVVVLRNRRAIRRFLEEPPGQRMPLSQPGRTETAFASA
jgi:adenylate kinase family enzyme